VAVTAHATGTLSTTGGSTEDFLTSPNVAGTFTLHVDLHGMATTHIIEIRVYQMVLTGGTTRVAYYTRVEGALINVDNKIYVSVPISNELTDTNALRFSIKQVAGAAGISLPWKVLRHS
jgi:hypothetical protein